MPPVETSATVLSVTQQTPCVKSFLVRPDDFVPYKPGQFMSVGLPGLGLAKPLSISSSPALEGALEFAKKITPSAYSRGLDALVPGSRLTLKYPFGNFTFRPDVRRCCFLSGGIGITPIIGLCRHAAETRADLDLFLFYGNRTLSDIAFRAELDALAKACPRLRVLHILSEEPSCCWEGPRGFITAGLVRETLPDFASYTFFVCGPVPMVDAMKRMVTADLGLPPQSLVAEQFAGY